MGGSLTKRVSLPASRLVDGGWLGYRENTLFNTTRKYCYFYILSKARARYSGGGVQTITCSPRLGGRFELWWGEDGV